MKATSRKRLLISSVAMLLVAMLALGTATFAWFSTKETADADGFSGASSKAAGLLISEDDANWSSSITYTRTSGNSLSTARYRAETLMPASSAFESLTAPVFYQGVAESPNNYAKAAADTFTTANYSASTNNWVNVYDLYAKTADESERELQLVLSANSTIQDAGSYGRIAIVRLANDATVADPQTSHDTDTLKMYYMAADTNTVYPVDSNGSVASAYETSVSGAMTNTIANTFNSQTGVIDLGKIKNSTHYVIYVWNEGQDYDCTTVTADKAFTFNFDLRLKPTA